MTPDPARVQQVFLATVDLPAADRATFLAAACEGDAALRDRVEALLKARDLPPTAGEVDATGAYAAADDTRSLPPAAAPAAAGGVPAGLLAGRYWLLEVLGEGGMGTVYRAEQVAPVRRQVAVKLVKPGLDSRSVLGRFEAERQALAVMDHPHIARVLDGGTTPDGRPFFVMELVDGVPLTDHCDAHRLPVRDRLALFAAVCRAVQHAHQKGVIHRDLKPSNVLVAVADGRPVPKVIDFGLAKALRADALGDAAVVTADVGGVLGTPLYMAPEQADGGADVDTRADVYALGVVLYELLTGTTPVDRAAARKAALGEVLRRIREVDPPTPARRLAADPQPAVAAARRTEPGRLAREVRGELDWITMKCLEKDRGRRYDTANALAADVDRYLANEPVAAGPPSRWYTARKFVRRNRTAATAAAAVLLALVAGVAGTAAGLVREAAARRDADDKRAEAEQARDRARASAVRMYSDRGFLAYEQGNGADGLLWHAHALAHLPADAGAERDELLRHAGAWAAPVPPLEAVVRVPTGGAKIALTADGTRLAVAHRAGVELFDAGTGRRLTTDPGDVGRKEAYEVSFSPDGRRLVTTHWNVGVRLWDGVTGRPLGPLVAVPGMRFAPAAFTPDGSTFAAAGDRRVFRFAAADGRPAGDPLPTGIGQPWAMTFSPDGSRLAVGGDGGVDVLDWAASRVVASLPHPASNVLAVAFHPDGRRLATGTHFRAAHLWDLSAAKSVWSKRLGGQVLKAVVTPTGRVLFACSDGAVRGYDTAGVAAPMPLLHHTSLTAVAADAGGRRLAVAGADGFARVYRLWAEPEGDGVFVHPAGVWALGGSRVLQAGGSVRVTDFAGGGAVVIDDPAAPSDGSLSADGRVAVLVAATTARFWDARTGRPLTEPIACGSGRAYPPRLSPDGRYAAVYRLRPFNTVYLLDATTGTGRTLDTGEPPERPNEPQRFAFGSDGAAVFVAGTDTRGTRWAVADGGRTRFRSKDRPHSVFDLKCGGGRVALAGRGIELFHERDGSLDRIIAQPGVVHSLAFDADGRRLLSGGEDGAVRLWDPATGGPVGRPWVGHTDLVQGIEFAPGGRIAASHDAGTVRLWDAATGRTLGPTWAAESVRGVGFTDEEERFAYVVGAAVRIVPVPRPLPDDAGRLKRWVAVQFGLEVTENDVAVELSPDDWYQRWQADPRPLGPLPPLPPDGERAARARQTQ